MCVCGDDILFSFYLVLLRRRVSKRNRVAFTLQPPTDWICTANEQRAGWLLGLRKLFGNGACNAAIKVMNFKQKKLFLIEIGIIFFAETHSTYNFTNSYQHNLKIN